MKNILLLILLTISTQLYSYSSLSFNKPSTGNFYYGGGSMKNISIIVYPKGLYAEISLTAELSAEGNSGILSTDTLESVIYFTLPDKSMMIDSWLWVDTSIVQANHLDRWTANAIYENIVKRVRRDPSILTKDYNNQYTLKVYPYVGTQSRKIRITYLVPIQTIKVGSSIPLPIEFIKAFKSFSDIKLTIFTTENYTVPLLGVSPESKFETTTINNKTAYITTIPSSVIVYYNPIYNYDYYYTYSYYNYNYNLINPFNINLTKGTEKKYNLFYNSDTEKHFELSFIPSKILENTFNKRVLFIIDQDKKYNSISISNISKTLKNVFKTNLDSTYYFNVGYYKDSASIYSKTWLLATNSNLELAFSDSTIFDSDSTNSEKLIEKAISFINSQDSSARISLITSNIKRYRGDTALKVVDRLVNKMKNKTPIDIVDHYYYYSENSTGNYPAYNPYIRINGINYYGNSFFYISLCKKTGGDFYESRLNYYNSSISNYNSYYYQYALNSFRTNIYKISENVVGKYELFEFQLIPSNGLSFSRYYLTYSNSANNISTNADIKVLGKYNGSFPFTLNISAMYNSKVINKSIVINQTDAISVDKIIETHWWGNYIQSKENNYDNKSISEVVDASLKYRILSRYTAFLCLEPSLGGTICTTCDENSPYTNNQYQDQVGVLSSIEDKEIEDSISVFSAYPNPAIEKITFRFKNTTLKNIELSIYNNSGALMFKKSIESNGSPNQDYEWDLLSNSGNKISSGIYFAQAIINGKVYKIKFIVN